MENGQEAGAVDDVSRPNPSCVWQNAHVWLRSVLFTLSFLDRTNVGTAKLAGLVQDLHMTQAQFNIARYVWLHPGRPGDREPLIPPR